MPPRDPLPWGVVRPRGGGQARPAVRLGDDAVVLAPLATPALLAPHPDVARALQAPELNALIELGPDAWRGLRERLREIVAAGAVPGAARVPLSECEAVLPIRVTDY